jgi:hypothetical protein
VDVHVCAKDDPNENAEGMKRKKRMKRKQQKKRRKQQEGATVQQQRFDQPVLEDGAGSWTAVT